MTASNFILPPGYRVRHLKKIDSTSEATKRLAHQGEGAGLWVLSDAQTKGKGRQGRTWTSLTGNLFASLLLYPVCDIKRLPELSFVAAVAVASTLREFSDRQITCKWPNDVLMEGKKVAGILLEAENSGNPHKPFVIIGIGINVKAAPEGVDYPATCLGKTKTRDRVFEVLADRIAKGLTRWGQDGFHSIRTLWLNQAEGIGRQIKIETGGKTLSGKMAGISKTGALLLETKQGTVIEIISGTVLKD